MILRKIKENLFFSLVVLAYILILIFVPSLGAASIKNSAYYLKEMLMIMPVIFILTALLDMWVPKEKIMQFLGKDAKIKGLMLSFVIGSISAGPIYAAFPMCVMLHKKGASIRNVVVILSSWAVIKIPMLLTEAKFLGPKFMIIRWSLTVVAILIFSWISHKIIKDTDLPQEKEEKVGLTINAQACMGCKVCADEYPALFEMSRGKAIVKHFEKEKVNESKLEHIINSCPVDAISYIKE